TYKSDEVVLLQYHLHIPRPDTLTNADTEARGEYYGVRSTPTMLIDGERLKDVGGFRDDAKESYDKVRKQIDKELESAAGATIKLRAARKGNKIDVSADVSGLKEPGEKVKLRFVLTEDVIRYVGSNPTRLHHH